MRATIIFASVILFAAQVLATDAATAADLKLIPRSSPESPASKSPAPASNVSIQAYGNRDSSCLVWTDGCRNCDRTDNGPSCSNIGIACQPGPIQCTKRSK
jgi:hypothetical protein